jgi:hypothetical protein
VDVTLRQAYARFPLEEDAKRVEFLGNVARTVTEAFTTTDLHSAPQLVRALSRATRGGHLKAYFNEPAEEQLMTELGADGTVPTLVGDSLLVVNQNMAANKLDAYLHRDIRYDIRLSPGGRLTRVSGQLAVTLRNELPSLGLPAAVTGPYNDQFRAGENRTYLSVYSPFARGAAQVDGNKVDAASYVDLGRISRSTVLSLDAGDVQTVTFGIDGKAELGKQGWYRLDLLRQPTLNPDNVDVALTVPNGWRIAEVRGAALKGRQGAEAHIALDQARTIWVRVDATGIRRFWERLMGRG